MGADFPLPQSPIQGAPSTDYAEVEKIFALADNIYEKFLKAREIRRRTVTIFFLGVSLIILSFVGAMIVYITSMSQFWSYFYGASFSLGLPLTILAIFLFYNDPRSGPILKTESRALRRVIDLLHELEEDLDRQSAWSPVQRAEFRIRLSRYVVDEK